MASIRQTKKTVQKVVAKSLATKKLASQGKASTAEVTSAAVAAKKTDLNGRTPGVKAGVIGKGTDKRVNRIVKKGGGTPEKGNK